MGNPKQGREGVNPFPGTGMGGSFAHPLHTLRPEASADDGKRRVSVLEVDVSPLRANKGGSLRGGRAAARWEASRGSVDFALCWLIFRSCGSFFRFFDAS